MFVNVFNNDEKVEEIGQSISPQPDSDDEKVEEQTQQEDGESEE